MYILLSLIFMMGGVLGNNSEVLFLASGLFAIADSIDALRRSKK